MYVKSNSHFRMKPPAHRRNERGVVLLISLIVLVVMTMSAIALIRSVNMSNLVAGNLAFRESAVLAGERSTEAALVNWLTPNASGAALHSHSAANGYRAVREDPGAGVSWDAFWNNTLAAQSVAGSIDVAGMSVSYVVHRMCDGVGAPHLVNCAKPSNPTAGGSQSAGGITSATSTQIYYRITTRITGPRNTVAYTQTVVLM